MPTCSRALKLHATSLPFLSGPHTAKMLHSSRNWAPSYPMLHSRQKNAKSYLGTVPKSLPSSSETVPLQQESARPVRWHGKGEVTPEALPRTYCHRTQLRGLKFSLPFWDSWTHCRASNFPAAATKTTCCGTGEEACQQQHTLGQLLHSPSPAIP